LLVKVAWVVRAARDSMIIPKSKKKKKKGFLQRRTWLFFF
jgi:hypothetical protein